MLQRKIEDFLPARSVYYSRDYTVHRQDYVSLLAKPLPVVEQSSSGVFMFV